jgi:GT2 family glycosyltransferase
LSAGIVGVACAELGRFSQFSSCLANLEKPPGTLVQFEVGIDVAINRRNIVRLALEREAEWVWFVDDDMLFGPYHLMNLLAHKKPIVASLYLNRKPPYFPVAYNRRYEVEGKPYWNPISLEGAPDAGLADIVAAGTGGLLVRTDVFRAMEYDIWFKRAGAGEDMSFCARAIEAGFPMYVDLGARMGHISTYSVWPMKGEKWQAGIGITRELMLAVELGT